MRGGFKKAYLENGKTLKPEYSSGPMKNHKLWTEYFKEHASGSEVVINKLPGVSGNRYLYVIDMQNDFIDRMYDDGFGKFAVGEGSSVIPDIINYVNKGINMYKEIIFSRDYHPEDHCSFGAGHASGGSFPSHCVQKTKGAELIKEINDKFTREWATKDNVRVIFKGIHSNADSFSAMPFSEARQDHSGPNCNACSGGANCSEVTGGWYLSNANGYDKNSWNYNGNITYGKESVTAEDGLIPVKYKPEFPDGSVIEVCGLAGDYCVRDTAIALGKTYPNCQVVVLNYLVRYPFLPIWLPTIMHTNTGAPVDTHMNHMDIFLNSDVNKGFNYYLFDESGKLMTPSEIKSSVPSVEALKERMKGFPEFTNVLSHFISDPRDIIKDYENSGVKILLNTPLTTSGGRFSRKSRRKANKRKSRRYQKK